MRIDKFLKVSRIIKRRSSSKEACDNEMIYINGRLSKPSKDVKVGDEVTLKFPNKSITIKIKTLSASINKEDADKMYEVIYE